MKVHVLAYNVDGAAAERQPALRAVLDRAAADVIALTEADNREAAAALADNLGFQHVWARGSGDRHAAVLSRWRITRSVNHTRPPLTQAALEVELALPDGRALSLYNVHLLPYLLLPFEVRRWQAVGRLLQVIRRRAPGPHVILGDLNAIAPGDRVLQRRNPARMRRMMALQFNLIFRLALPRLLRAGYVDCYRRLHPNEDGFTWQPRNRTTRYDYILADPVLARSLKTCQVLDDIPEAALASDHLPVLAEFDY